MMSDVVTGDRLLTGRAYLDSLNDGREVWIAGERVDDVTVHSAFRNAARSVARLYDAMHDPAHRDVLVAEDRHGMRTHPFFMPSYTTQDLLNAREAMALWARLTYGYMGRTPDYKASFMATLGADPSGTHPSATARGTGIASSRSRRCSSIMC
jgi:4-hydroxyphenylacetate 3-monooxygenase